MLFNFNNAFYDTASICNLEETNQKVYVREVLKALENLMPDFNDYRFYFFCATAGIEPDAINDHHPKKILIQWEDQLGTEPSKKVMASFLCVFKTHLRKTSIQYHNLFSYPLGVPYKIAKLPIVPINDRKYNVFYSGNLNKNRVLFYKALVKADCFSFKKYFSILFLRIAGKYEYSNRWRNWSLRLKSLVFKIGAINFNNLFGSSIIKFTRAFEKGLPPTEYAEILSQSKIVLSPKGFFNTECFRFYEALRQGCIVITEKLPVTDYYKSEYYIEVESWDGIELIINSLLTDRKKLENLSMRGKLYYQECLSPIGTAKYILSKITKKQLCV
ncbi:hypothetical protein [Phocaeicola sp.]